jgi:hypothetical protein
VRLTAAPGPGFRFAGWQGTPDPSPVHCDGADSNNFLASGDCQLGTFSNMGIRAIFVDDTPPALSWDTLPAQYDRASRPRFLWHWDQFATTSSCALDGVPVACSGGFFQPAGALADGPHAFEVAGRDPSGNLSLPYHVQWTVDTVTPDTTLTTTPPVDAAGASATFGWSSSEAAWSSECSLDGGAFVRCTNPLTITVAPGTHSILVRNIDRAGNVDPTPASYSWTYDTVPPTVSLLSGPANGALTGPDVSWSFSADEPVSFQCALDGPSFASCSSPASYHLAPGAHQFQLRAVDRVGLMSSPLTVSFTVDGTPPTIALGKLKAVQSKKASFPVKWSPGAGAASSSVRYREATPTAGLGGYVTWQDHVTFTQATFTGLPGHTYCFSAQATSAAGVASAWTKEACTALPLDDRALSATPGAWTWLNARSYYLGTVSRATSAGAALSLAGVQARQVQLVVTQGAGMGTVRVVWNGVEIGRYSLAGASKTRALLPLPPFASVQSGNLSVESVSDGLPVEIDGVALVGA